MPEPTQELLAIADELYGLPLGEFTPARDARVKQLKGTELAAPVKALRKPSLAAWVVDLLVRRDADQVAQVLGVGEALRAAQESMSADDLRALTRQRRQLTAAVTTQARQLARERGQRVTDAVAEQVEATLTAAMIDERCAAAVRSGLLVAALSSTGVGDVELDRAVALPEAWGFQATPQDGPAADAPPVLRVVPDPDADAKAIAAAREALETAREELDTALAALDEAAGAVSDLQARGMQVQAEIDEHKRAVADLEATADDIDEELAEAEDTRAEADDALVEARSGHDAAAAALARLTGDA